MHGEDARPLAGQPWLTAPASRTVLAALDAGGQPVRFVGGCVRDALAGRRLVGRELDLATPKLPERVLNLLRAGGIRAVPTGLAHGTVTAVVDGQHFEITTLRRDVRTDGRRAVVAFSEDFKEDAARRDFTINAMSCDRDGRLFDYFGGRADLAAGRVRFVGRPADRIAEDYLRILRFFRFFAHYGRPPADAEALEASAGAAPNIRSLSGERVRTETLRLLEAADPLPALRLMAATSVLEEVLGGPGALDRLARLLEVAPDADALLRLGALLRPPPAAPEATDWVIERWRLSNQEADRLGAMACEELPALTASPAKRRRALYRLGSERYLDLIRLAAADAGADGRAALEEATALARGFTRPALPLNGRDLLERGAAPGPKVGEILRRVESWWVDEDFRPDRAACLARAEALLAGEAARRSDG